MLWIFCSQSFASGLLFLVFLCIQCVVHMCKLFGFAINEVNVCIIEFVGGVLKDIYNIGTLGLLIIARQHVGC